MVEPKAPKMVIDVAEPEPEVTEVLPVTEELVADEEAVEPVDEGRVADEPAEEEALPSDEVIEQPEGEPREEAPCSEAPIVSQPASTSAADLAPEEARSSGNWLSRTFPGHECTFCGAMSGLTLSILVFTIGPWRTLVVATLTGAGALFGLYLDGDMRFVQAIGRLFGKGNK